MSSSVFRFGLPVLGFRNTVIPRFFQTKRSLTLPSMGKKHSTPGEELLLLPAPPTALPVVDTHTHVATTFEFYRGRYKDGMYTNVFDFVKGMYGGRNVEALLDVWCEAPVNRLWKEFADAAVEENGKKWGGIQYWFAMGTQISSTTPSMPAD